MRDPNLTCRYNGNTSNINLIFFSSINFISGKIRREDKISYHTVAYRFMKVDSLKASTRLFSLDQQIDL